MARSKLTSMALAVLVLQFGHIAPNAARGAEPPVHHIVIFQFKKDTTPQEINEIAREFARLPARAPGITGFQWGTNNSPEPLSQGFTHAFIVTLENRKARDVYMKDPAHRKFADELALPKVEKSFVFDFEMPDPPPPAEPGRTHHLVFFKYKDSTGEEMKKKVADEFAGLTRKVPGLLQFQSGPSITPEKFEKGFNGFWLTFINERTRNDYINHPAHKEFGRLVGPILDEVLVLDFTVRPSTRSLFVTDGLEPFRVYQRNEEGKADLKFGGVSMEDGPIEARLRSGRRTVAGFDWKVVGEAKGGSWEAVLPEVPAGGEYTVEVRRRDSLGNVATHAEVADILVGDLWILAGQSNMEGVGDLVDVEPPDPLVHVFTMAHRWEMAKEPLHWLIDSPDPVHHGGRLKGLDENGRRAVRAEARSRRNKGAGLGLPFATELAHRTGVPIGLIASAHGGTSMKQWDPEGRDRGGETLYGSMYKQVKNASGKVRGVLWYQGESDANPTAVPEFAERFQKLIEAFRKDFDQPGLPFYYVQIGRFVQEQPSEPWDAIQELQRQAELTIPGVAMISVIDLPLDDLIHVGTQGLKRAGKRLAKIAHRELFGAKKLERGPRPVNAKVSPDGKTIRVTFSGVNGSLLPADNIKGFSIRRGMPPRKMWSVFNASVDPDRPGTVILKLQKSVSAEDTLWYGAGLDPVCNLLDQEDMAAPVFGPMKIDH